MSDGTINDGSESDKGVISPLVMFPASKNFEIEDERDPLKDLLNEFAHYEDSDDESQYPDDLNYDPDKTYIRKLPDLKEKNSQDLLGLLEEFHFYLCEIDQYWHD